ALANEHQKEWKAAKTFQDQVQALRTLSNKARKLDLAGCPDDFKLAYERHVKACEGHKDRAEDALKQITALTGADDSDGRLSARIRKILAQLDSPDEHKAMKSTWAAVEEAAAKQGVVFQAPREDK